MLDLGNEGIKKMKHNTATYRVPKCLSIMAVLLRLIIDELEYLNMILSGSGS